MTDTNEIGAEVTKQTYRKQIWDHIIKNQLTKFPMSVVNRIPIFKGSTEAAQRILLLDEFIKAKVIKVNHIASQEPVRFLTLEAKKEILIPMLKMESRLFNHVVPQTDNKKEIKHLASPRGIEAFGRKLGLDSDIKVDLIVLGSVCVTRKGHRIGTGEGFADLEFAILKRMGAINEATTIVTTVHDCQIIDDIPLNIFEKHDVPVDIILTPTETIIINERLKRPNEIFWDILTPYRLKSLKALQQLRSEDEKRGKNIELKPDDIKQRSSERPLEKRVSRRKEQKQKLPLAESDLPTVDNEGIADISKKEGRRARVSRKRQPRDQQQQPQAAAATGERESSTDPTNTVEQPKEKLQQPRKKSTKSRGKTNIDFSLKLSNIKSDMRVRDLKNALFERGVRPTEIAWHGQRGYCYLHFGKLRSKDTAKPVEPVQVDSIVKNLENLRIGPINEDDTQENEYIVVEPAKPITRIEITDVTSV